MFKKIRSVFRSIAKQKTYALINISGLTIGLCACLVIATVVIDDLSYDQDWKRGKDLYRIVTVNAMGDGVTDRWPSSFAGLPPELRKNFPEVESYAPLSTGEIRLKVRDESSQGVKTNTLVSDSAIWELLDLHVLAGDPHKFIAGQKNMVITESFRKLHFAGVEPIGKIIYDVPVYSDKPTAHLITGVIRDLPGNTHLRADVLILNKRRTEDLNKTQFGSFSQNYILLKPTTNIKNFTNKINKWYKSFVEVPKAYSYQFQPIRSVYLDSDFASYQKVKGNRQNIYIFSGVALLLLLIACVNFINLSTARSATRLRETGVRKVMGATKRQIMFQFLGEAVLVFVISTLIAICIYQLSLGYVERYLEHPLVRTFLSEFVLLSAAIAIIGLVGIVTGLYPAWLMTGVKTASSLKGSFFGNSGKSNQWLRKSLVVLQFSISIIVLIAMLIVQLQLRYMTQSDIGFDKNNLMNIASVSWDGKGSAFRNEVEKLPGVQHASITSWAPSSGPGYMSREIDDPDHPGNKVNVWHISGDIHLAETIGFRLKSGRLLSADFISDAINEDSLMEHDMKTFNTISEKRSSLMTETTARILHVSKLDAPLSNVKTVPVGIIGDFHNESFHKKIGPTIIFADSNPGYGGMLIRTDKGYEKQVTQAVRNLWQKFYPDKLLDISWVDELIARQYLVESKLKELFAFFSILTMILAALGIFGLIVHAAQQRVKEIGVRKILGASITSIFRLLSFEFIILVFVALLIASPVAWYVMTQWLNNYSYRIQIPWWSFAFAGIVTITAALITVSFQSVKAAVANPVDSLRND